MQIQVPYWEYHGWQGKSGDTACPTILNTDLTQTTVACSTFTYTLIPDGGVTGVASVSTSTGSITYGSTVGWMKIAVSCGTCGPGGIALPSVTVYVENHGNSSSSVTFPHHTTCGLLATSFTTGSCHSFYPISAWQANVANSPPAWLGPALTRANVNSVLDGFTYTTNLTNPAATSCPTWPDGTMATIANFANTWNIYLEYDMYPVWFTLGNNATALAAILNNIGYNRRACLQGLVSYLTSLGRVWRIYNDDEVSDYIGNYLEPNPAIGGANWTNATTAAGVLTFNVANITTLAAWNQSTGAGNAIQITGATTNSCMNGWHLLTTVSSTTLTTPAGACPNGLTINSSSDPSAAMNLPFPGLASYSTVLLQNAGPLPGNLTATQQFWDNKLDQHRGQRRHGNDSLDRAWPAFDEHTRDSPFLLRLRAHQPEFHRGAHGYRCQHANDRMDQYGRQYSSRGRNLQLQHRWQRVLYHRRSQLGREPARPVLFAW